MNATSTTIQSMLSGGDRRSIGNADSTARQVLQNPDLFDELFLCISHSDHVVRMRAADVIEKVTREKPELLHKYKTQILRKTAFIDQQEVQWHIAQVIPRLTLTARDMENVMKVLDLYLKTSKSNIVRVMSLQALADLAMQGKIDKDDAREAIESYAELVDTPSVKARARKLIKQLSTKGKRNY